MKIAAVINPPTETNLRTIAQIGVEDQVYYNMGGMPTDLEGLHQESKKAERNGLRLSVVEGGPKIDLIVLGKEGRDAQIETYKRSIDHMGRLGIRVLCYNFMPQIMDDAMVVRTSLDTRERAGARTSSFELARFDNDRVTGAGSTKDEQMWDNLDYFLQRVIPAAEAAGVMLAMHPDDPPLSPMWQLARIMRSMENYERLFALHPSPVNGMTFCQGCFTQLGVDLAAAIKRLAPRIHFAHFRDVAGKLTNFRETFPDNGPTDMVKVLQAYKNMSQCEFIRIDHVPHLDVEGLTAGGYGLQSHIFAIGYLKGLMEPIFGKTGTPVPLE